MKKICNTNFFSCLVILILLSGGRKGWAQKNIIMESGRDFEEKLRDKISENTGLGTDSDFTDKIILSAKEVITEQKKSRLRGELDLLEMIIGIRQQEREISGLVKKIEGLLSENLWDKAHEGIELALLGLIELTWGDILSESDFSTLIAGEHTSARLTKITQLLKDINKEIGRLGGSLGFDKGSTELEKDTSEKRKKIIKNFPTARNYIGKLEDSLDELSDVVQDYLLELRESINKHLQP